MSLAFMAAACVFALVLGCAVAWVDRWREARLAAPRLKLVAPVSADVRASRPAPQRRAA
jgi:hypothetical protein